MSENITRFDEKKLEEYIIQFALAVREQDGIEFQSFSSSAYLTRSESYKQSIYQEGHAICMGIGQKGMDDEKVLNEIQRALKCGSSGKGAPASFYNVTKFMEIARKDGAKAAAAFRDFYLKDNEEKGYNEICDLGCCRYDILALLAFYKDCNRYLPIRSSEFAKRFQMLGYTVELAGRYDWDSYHRDYLDAISEVRKVLIEYLDVSSDAIAFLDAHSFVWLLPQYEKLAGERVKKFILNPKGATGKATVVRQRAGQSEYRKNLISLWDGKCSVTGCGNTSMLTASHIKPWKDSNEGAVERVDPYNGLLLIPNLDRAFDQGLISFNDDGTLLISSELSQKDAACLGINTSNTRLTKVNEETQKYLAYHRENVYKK